MAKKNTSTSLDEQRKRQILDAALYCFLQYGYAKTSMDDVAKKAGMSRPAVYLKFKNKLDLFHGIYLDLSDQGLEKANAFLKGSGSKKEKLSQICEALILEPWGHIADSPRAAEFYDLCFQLVPEESDKIERRTLKILEAAFHDKETAEIFLLAVEGFYSDLPSMNVLRKRLNFLIGKFI